MKKIIIFVIIIFTFISCNNKQSKLEFIFETDLAKIVITNLKIQSSTNRAYGNCIVENKGNTSIKFTNRKLCFVIGKEEFRFYKDSVASTLIDTTDVEIKAKEELKKRYMFQLVEK